MVFEDVTAIMVPGETRFVAPGKMSFALVHPPGVSPHDAPEVGIVLLGEDRMPVPGPAVISASGPRRRDRSVRFLLETGGDFGWTGCVFEISTLLLPDAVKAVSIVADGVASLDAGSHLSLEDGMSSPHVFPFSLPPGSRTASLAVLYRHGDGWKFRAIGEGYSLDRGALAAQIGAPAVAWPRIERPVPRVSTPATPPPGPAAPRPGTASVNRQPSPSPGSAETGPPGIDLSRLHALERDTAAVSSLLSDIFSDTSAPPAPPASPPPAGLDRDHGRVLRRLMDEGSMTSADFEQACRESGLMPAGAEEAINEWAIETVGEIAVLSDGAWYRFDEIHREALSSAVRH